MFDPSYTASHKDAPKVNSVSLDGFTVLLPRNDPFGHIYLTLEQGEVSEKYRGAYTDMRMAESDARRYLDDRKKALAEINVPTKSNSRREQLR